MYHSASHFLIVPYNATEYQVGNGHQERESETEDEDDADADADEDGALDTTVDWSLLSFHWKGEGTLSGFSVV
jgi:hypothetical protein